MYGETNDDDDKEFYQNAAATFTLPKAVIKTATLQLSNPSIFAVLSKASSFFKDSDMDLKEGMVMGDYKELTKLRLKNYIVILRMLTRVDPSLYGQV
jgi:hypothetical protein